MPRVGQNSDDRCTSAESSTSTVHIQSIFRKQWQRERKGMASHTLSQSPELMTGRLDFTKAHEFDVVDVLASNFRSVQIVTCSDRHNQ